MICLMPADDLYDMTDIIAMLLDASYGNGGIGGFVRIVIIPVQKSSLFTFWFKPFPSPVTTVNTAE